MTLAPPDAGPVVVDTNVFSYLFKGDSRAAGYQEQLAGRRVVLSFMSVAELQAWADARRWGRRARERLERAIGNCVLHFPDRQSCALWARVVVAARRAGRPIGPADAWVAATALFFDIPLVTHNPGDYVGVADLTVISEAPM